MSQVNKFKQDQNPDFLYFDLQQTNIQNTTEFQQQPLKFVETRDTPIVANSGEYHLSVTRFQVDTYNLPVLVAEPDLTQEGIYDPNQTIYKIAMIPKFSNIPTGIAFNTDDYSLQATILGSTQTYTPNLYQFGKYIATLYSDTKTDLCLAIAEPTFSQDNTETLTGDITIVQGTITSNSVIKRLRAADGASTSYKNQKVGDRGIAMGQVSSSLVRVVASTETKGLALYEFNPVLSNPFNVNIKAHIDIQATAPVTVGISGNGNRIFVANSTLFDGTYKVYNFNSTTLVWTQVGNTKTDAVSNLYGRGAFLDATGTYLITGSHTHDSARGYVCIDYLVGSVWTSTPNQFSTAIANSRFGYAMAMAQDGNYACASALGQTGITPFINVFKRTSGTNTWTLSHTINGILNINWGASVSMSNDGSTIVVGAITTNTVYTYRRGSGVETYTLLDTTVGTSANFGTAVAINKGGTAFYTSNNLISTTLANSVFVYEELDIPVGSPVNFNSAVKDKPIITPLIWTNDYKDEPAPQRSVLTGKNTALYKYYYCNAYENFIKLVNNTIKTAYITMINTLYNDWIVPLGNTSITNQFLDIVIKHYAPPPFLQWSEAELKAELYATLLFETNQYLNDLAVVNNTNNTDYAVRQYTWATVSSNFVGTPLDPTPLKFEIAMNAALYSLFNSLPASKKVLTSSTGYRENYYILNFFTTGQDLVTPAPALNQFPLYSFISSYANSAGVITFPTQYTTNYSHANKLIRQPQELSTIDTWTPVNAIVFTTTSLPIVINQFSATSSIGDKPPSTSTSNEFAFIITDIQSNDQGFRPNLIYTPSAQYRYIDMTGNQPIRNIDISVYWRTTTGDLIPFVLASGAMASIKLLFEKKDKTNQKEANATSIDKNSSSVRDIV